MKSFFRLAVPAMLVLLLLPPAASAQNAEDIVRRADAPFAGNRIYSKTEITVYRSGKPGPTMELETFTMDKQGIDCSLTIYLQPARMKGTAYLAVGNDLWVRFSSTGRIRKLSSSAKKNSAGGTDFSYIDMGEGSNGIAEKYEVRLEDKGIPVEGRRCYRIVYTPKVEKDVPYEKLITYIDQENLRYLRIDYFEKGAVIKSLHFSDYRPVGSTFYPFKLIMQSHTRASRTALIALPGL